MKNLLIILFTCFSLVVMAQKNKKQDAETSNAAASEYHIAALSRTYTDSVVLRFAPQEPVFWKAAIRAGGFTIKRVKIENNKATETKETIIKPWTLDEWKKKSRPTDSTAAVCAQLMYGKIRKFDNKKPALGDLMNQSNDQNTTLGFALMIADVSPFHAVGMGLRYVDKTVSKKSRYLYTIQLLNQPTLPHKPAKIVVETDEVYKIPLLPEIEIKGLDKVVEISWRKGGQAQEFSAYWLEKSENNGQTFKRINKRPWIPDARIDALFSDSLKQNYKTYYYRVIGITPFGELSDASPILKVNGRDLVGPSPVSYLKVEHIKDRQIKLTWEKKVIEPDMAGYILGLANNAEGPFEPISKQIVNKDLRTLTLEVPQMAEMNYFVVSTIDTSHNTSKSIPAYLMLKDNTPPAVPKGLQGKIDTTGFVKLKWTFNTEPDFLGYMIYFANDPDHEFIPLTKDFLVEPAFTDSITLKTLSKEIYYRLRSYDMHQNPSAFSDIFMVKKPDRVAPMAAVFEKYFVTDSAVNFSWQNSVSEDAISQIIYRKEEKSSYVEIAKLPIAKREYNDKTAKQGKTYTYGIVTIDNAGLKSPMSFPLKVSVSRSGYSPALVGLVAQLATDKKSILVTWKKAAVAPKKIVIYRQVNNEPLTFYDKIDGTKMEYSDFVVEKGSFQYAIKGVYENKDETVLSKLSAIITK